MEQLTLYRLVFKVDLDARLLYERIKIGNTWDQEKAMFIFLTGEDIFFFNVTRSVAGRWETKHFIVMAL